MILILVFHSFIHFVSSNFPTRELEEDTEDESLDLGTKREGSKGEGHRSEDVGRGLEDEGPSIEEVSARSVPEHEGAERVSAFRQPTLVTWVDPKDGKVYIDILTYVPPVALVQTPPSSEWLFSSLPVVPSPLVVPSPIASPVTTSAATISVDEDQFLEGYDRYLMELYTRSGAVRDEIFSQRENPDLRRQIPDEWREQLELTDYIASVERRQESRGEY
nr:hypothetical protein [Tanacetum cinerariifolium]